MDVKTTAGPDSKLKVEVTVPAVDVNRKIAGTYRDIARQYNFPGFRRGHAPRPVINNIFGRDTLYKNASQELVEDCLPGIIEQERLYPVGRPELGEIGTIADDEDFNFSFDLEVKPEIKLSSYDPLQIEIPSETVPDEEVEQEIEGIRRRYTSYQDADPSVEIGDGNSATLSIVANEEDGTPCEFLTNDDAVFSPFGSLYSADFASEIKGLKEGDECSFTLDVPQDEKSVYMSDVAGKKVSFTVRCKKVRELKLPDLTDDWAKMLGYESVDDLRKNVSEELSVQRSNLVERYKEDECGKALEARVDVEPPKSMVDEEEGNILQTFFSNLQERNTTFENYLNSAGLTSAQFRFTIKRQARQNVLRGLALDAWASSKDIGVDDAEVSLEFTLAGVEDPAERERQMREGGTLYLIRENIIRRKAMKDAEEGAEVKEISLEEYSDRLDAEDALAQEEFERQNADASDGSEATEPTEQTEPADQAEPTEQTETAEPSEPTEAVERAETPETHVGNEG